MRKKKLFLSGQVYFITFNTEEGLPFVPLAFMNTLIRSAIARAQRLYPVTIIGFTFQANHCHIIIRVIDPEAVSSFIGYLKAECAHYLNALLGRKQRTVWAARFDDPIVLDLQTAIKYLCYTLLNPVKDGLVDAMHEYPGVSSYHELLEGRGEIAAKNIPRNAVYALKNPDRPDLEDEFLREYYQSESFEDLSIKVDPEALRLTYPETRDMSREDFRRILLDNLREAEARFRRERGENPPVGAKRLCQASILQSHTPPKSGRKMLCVAASKEVRIPYIRFYRARRGNAEAVFEQWKAGDLAVPFPAGMCAPHPPRIANLWPPPILCGYT